MFDVHDCIGFITNHGAKVICEAMNEQFKKKNITRVQWMALYYISKGENFTQKDLAKAMMISEPSVVHLVERLQQEGFIARSSSAENHRAKLLTLTSEGTQVLDALFPFVEEFNLQGICGISEDELEVFKRVLDRMINNVQTLEDSEEEASCSESCE